MYQKFKVLLSINKSCKINLRFLLIFSPKLQFTKKKCKKENCLLRELNS